MNNYVFVIQARMGSKRLPGKVLKCFDGMPLIGHIYRILETYNLAKKIIIATSSNSENDDIERYCLRNNMLIFRGSEDNVLSRYQQIALENLDSDIVRLTGDNPFPNYRIIKDTIDLHNLGRNDLTTTRKVDNQKIIRYVPKGLSVDVIRNSSLSIIENAEINEFDKEHVIPIYFRGKFSIGYCNSYKMNDIEYSIDTMEDFIRLEKMWIESKRENNSNILLGIA